MTRLHIKVAKAWVVAVLGLLMLCTVARAADDVVSTLDGLLADLWLGRQANVEVRVSQLQLVKSGEVTEAGRIGRLWLLHLSSINQTAPRDLAAIVTPSPDPALQPLRQCYPSDMKLADRPTEIQIQVLLLRALAEENGPATAAYAALESMGASASGILRLRIMEAIAIYHRDRQHAKDYEQWLKDANRQMAALSGSYPPVPDILRTRIREMVAQLASQHAVDDYGAAWLAYREAETLRIRGNVALARDANIRAARHAQEDHATAPILIQAIAWQRLQILAMDLDGDFLKETAVTAARDTVGMWEGDLLIQRGDALFVKGDLAGAAREYQGAEVWLNDRASAKSTNAIPASLAKVATPPETWRSPTTGGSRKINQPVPGQLWNPATSAWYVPQRQVEVILKQAVVAFVGDDPKSAMQHVERMRTTDREDAGETSKGMPSIYRRFKDGFATGGLWLSNEERAMVPKQAANALWLIEIAHEMELWQDTLTLVDGFLTRYRSIGSGAVAPALVLRANALEFVRDTAGAARVLREVIAKYPKLPSQARAMIRLSQITESFDTESVPLLERVANDFPGTRWNDEADMMRATIIFHRGQVKPARLLVEQVAKRTTNATRREEILARLSYFDWEICQGNITEKP